MYENEDEMGMYVDVKLAYSRIKG